MDQPHPDPSAPPTSNPDGRLSDTDLLNMGVDPSARGFVEAWAVVFVGLFMAGTWLWNGGRRLLSGFMAWNRKEPSHIAVTVLSVAVLVLGFIAYNGHDSTATPITPKAPATAVQAPADAPRKHKVKAGEHLASIGKMYGISRLDMQKANPGINVDKLAIGQIVNVPTPQVANNTN